jgi:hypothetical protein
VEWNCLASFNTGAGSSSGGVARRPVAGAERRGLQPLPDGPGLRGEHRGGSGGVQEQREGGGGGCISVCLSVRPSVSLSLSLFVCFDVLHCAQCYLAAPRCFEAQLTTLYLLLHCTRSWKS